MLEILVVILIVVKIVFGVITVHEIRKPQMVIIRKYNEMYDDEEDELYMGLDDLEEESDISI